MKSIRVSDKNKPKCDGYCPGFQMKPPQLTVDTEKKACFCNGVALDQDGVSVSQFRYVSQF